MKKLLSIIVSLLLSTSAFAELSGNKPIINLPALPNPVVIAIVPPVFDVDFQADWNAIVDRMMTPTTTDVILKVAGYGGDVMEGTQFIHRLMDAESQGVKIHMQVEGPTYSMHAFMVCFGSDVRFMPGGTLMFHHIFGMNSLMLGNVVYKNDSMDPAYDQVEAFLLGQCMNKGILTKQNVIDILNGKEVYVTQKPDGTLVTYTSRKSADNDELYDSLFHLGINLAFILTLLSLVVFIIRRVGK